MHVMKLQEAREHLSKVVYDAIYNDPHRFINELADVHNQFSKEHAKTCIILVKTEEGREHFAKTLSDSILDPEVVTPDEVAETWMETYDTGPKVVYDPGTDSLVTVPESLVNIQPGILNTQTF